MLVTKTGTFILAVPIPLSQRKAGMVAVEGYLKRVSGSTVVWMFYLLSQLLHRHG
jgi:hypothetical protein